MLFLSKLFLSDVAKREAALTAAITLSLGLVMWLLAAILG